jgi:hypothetical protein
MDPGNKCRDDSDVGGENKRTLPMKSFSCPHPEEAQSAVSKDEGKKSLHRGPGPTKSAVQ